MGTNMKYSIKKQFAGVICLLIAGTILLCWFINNTLLENYYLNNKQNVLMYAYHYINAATNEGKFNTEEFDIEFQKIIGKYNISFIVLDAETQTFKASANDYEILSKELLKNIFGSGSNPKARLLEKGDSYEISIMLDDWTKTEFVEMWGVLDNGNLFLFRNPLESIKESVKLANRFLAYVGIFAAVLGALVALWVSDRKSVV